MYLLSFHILSISHCGPPGQQNPQFFKFSFIIIIVIIIIKIWSSGRDLVIRLYYLASFSHQRNINIVIIIIIPCEFFTPALAEGLSLKSEWQ